MERKVNLEHLLIKYGFLTGDCPSSSPHEVKAAMYSAICWLDDSSIGLLALTSRSLMRRILRHAQRMS